MREAAADLAPDESGLFAGFGPTPDAPVAAAPAGRLATADDLRTLCGELGRDAWSDKAFALSQVSIRLTHGGDGSSSLGGSPGLPRDVEWPTAGDARLPFLARIRLDDLPETLLPREGALLVFADLDDESYADEPRPCAVRHVTADESERRPSAESLPVVPVVASAELTLPFEPESLELDAWELSDWAELREHLAALQGTVLEETAPDYHAIHRLLGHGDALIDPLPPGAEEDDASAWQLLFQLSGDDALGVSFGPYARLLIWIRKDDLRAGRFDGVRATIG